MIAPDLDTLATALSKAPRKTTSFRIILGYRAAIGLRGVLTIASA